MKKKTGNIIVLFFASIILFIGAGMTVIDFCCSICSENVWSSITDSTPDIIDTEFNESEHSCCETGKESSRSTSSECCKISRITTDLESQIYNPKITKTTSLTLIDRLCSICIKKIHIYSPTGITLSYSYISSIKLPPEAYLTLLRRLII